MVKMTSLERVLCVRRGAKPDILPLNTGPHNDFICHYYGISIEDYLHNVDFCAECDIRCVREFEIDSSVVTPGYILYGCGPELGMTWKFVEGHFPGFIEGPLKSESDLDKIRVPDRPSGYFRHYLAILTRVNRELGRDYALTGHILGVFAVACFLRGIQEALLDTLMDKGFFLKYIQKCTKLSIYFGQNVIATGINNPMLNEIFLTPEMIGPDSFHELIGPHDRRVQEALGPENIKHILGAGAMGRPGDRESQKQGALQYRAFFASDDSLETFRKAVDGLPPKAPVAVALSGGAFDNWDMSDILAFYTEAIGYTISTRRVYPSIFLPSLMPKSPGHAREFAEKLNQVNDFRKSFQL